MTGPNSVRLAFRELYEAQDSLPECFERVVIRHAHRTALGSDAWQPTYEELNAAANRCAHHLRAVGVTPGDRVALLMQHDSLLMGGMLAILKAGAIVVVLNSTDPPARMKQLVEDCEPAVVLTDGPTREAAIETARDICSVAVFDPVAQQGPDHNPDIRTEPDGTAVLGYTSGATGRPKAVMLTHRQMVHNAARFSEAALITENDRIAGLASLSGYQGMNTCWSALLNGASLWPFSVMDRGVADLAAWMTDRGITIYVLSASVFRHFMSTLPDQASFPRVRAVKLASEPATSSDFKAFQKHFSDSCILLHSLASSETGQIAILRLTRSDSVAEGRLPVGRVLEGMDVQLLGEDGQPVRAGEVGEIVVTSRFLCGGYWRNPELTAERFFSAPDGSGMRVYRTGDFGVLRPDGLLETAGRKDAVVKIRGNRIDPADVERFLLRMPGVEAVAVCADKQPDREAQLVAFVVPSNAQSTSAATLRRAMGDSVARHMVPSAFVFLERFPLLPSGKIDYAKLLQLRHRDPKKAPAEPPQTETEARLMEIWTEAFDEADIGRDENFFDLGGDSLIASVIGARVLAVMGVELDLGAVAEYPRLAALAARIDALRRDRLPTDAIPLVRVSREQAIPASFFQEQAWTASQSSEESARYSGIYRYRITGPLDRDVLRNCMTCLARRHESLRTTFAMADGRLIQMVHPPNPEPLTFMDFSGVPGAEAWADKFVRVEAARPFDLERGPLLRFSLIGIRESEHWLLCACHHIIHDAWSWDIYWDELALLYEAEQRGEAPPLPVSEPVQYADYAAWQRANFRTDGTAYRDAVLWWQAALAGAPQILELPCRRKEPVTGLHPDDGLIRFRIDPGILPPLAAIGQAGNATAYVVRLAAYIALLSAETGKQDVVVGTYVMDRSRPELQTVFGFFVNLVPLRFRCAPAMSFRSWLSVVRQSVEVAVAHGGIPFEELSRELRGRDTPPPDIQTIFRSSRRRDIRPFGGLKVTRLEYLSRSMPWGLTVRIDEHDDGDDCRLSFDAGLYDPVGIRALADRYAQLLEAIARNPDSSLDVLISSCQ